MNFCPIIPLAAEVVATIQMPPPMKESREICPRTRIQEMTEFLEYFAPVLEVDLFYRHEHPTELRAECQANSRIFPAEYLSTGKRSTGLRVAPSLQPGYAFSQGVPRQFDAAVDVEFAHDVAPVNLHGAG